MSFLLDRYDQSWWRPSTLRAIRLRWIRVVPPAMAKVLATEASTYEGNPAVAFAAARRAL
jgi:hypothetical protein